jgi:hypothetical protein
MAESGSGCKSGHADVEPGIYLNLM